MAKKAVLQAGSNLQQKVSASDSKRAQSQDSKKRAINYDDPSDSSEEELDFDLPSKTAEALKTGSKSKGGILKNSSAPVVGRTFHNVNFDDSDSESESDANSKVSELQSESESEENAGRSIVGSIAKGLSDIKHSRNRKKMDFGSDSEDEDEDSGPITKLTVNKDFKKQFEKSKEAHSLSKEHQRAMESLQAQLREQAKREKRAKKRARQLAAVKAGEEYVDSDSEEDDESDYSSEDEDGNLLTTKSDLKILEVLQKIRKRDESIYKKDSTFFEEEEEEENDSEKVEELKKKQRRLTLGDLIARKAKEGLTATEMSDSDFDPYDENRPLTYNEEQDALRKALIETANQNSDGSDNDDDFFGKAKKVYSPEDDAQSQVKKEAKKQFEELLEPVDDGEAKLKASRARGIEKLKKRVLGEDANELKAERADRFLQAYVIGGLWKPDADKSILPSATTVLGKERSKLLKVQMKASKRSKKDDEDDDEGGFNSNSSDESDNNESDAESADSESFDFDEDDKYLDETDAFEAKYNFRFEEPGADEVMTYPRPHTNTDNSVRKASSRTESRKSQRQRKKDRLQAEKQRKLDEFRRLKSLQRKAVAERLAVIAQVAGLKVNARTGAVEDDEAQLNEDDLEKPNFDDEDDEEAIAKMKEKMFGKSTGGIASLTMSDLTSSFDEKEHDRRMNEIFGEEFYKELDEDSDALEQEEMMLKRETAELAEDFSKQSKDPSSDSSDEESSDDDQEGSDEESKKEKAEIKKLREETKKVQEKIKQREKASKDFIAKSLTQVIKAEDTNEEAEFWMKKEAARLMKEFGHELPPSAHKLPKKELLRQLMEIELRKADEEAEKQSGLGALRFDYESVPASDFGMSVEEILSLPDKELNMRVGMKKLAPYRDDADWLATRDWRNIRAKQPGLGDRRGAADMDDEESAGPRLRWVDRGRKQIKPSYRPDPYAHLKSQDRASNERSSEPRQQKHNNFTKQYRKQDNARPEGKKVTFG